MSMMRKITKGEYQIGIYNVKCVGGIWMATTPEFNFEKEFRTLEDAYEFCTGETVKTKPPKKSLA